MFDPKIPYNDLPLLPNDFEFDQKVILKKTIEANNALAKLNGLVLLLPNAELLMCPLLTKESVESNAIENINTTTMQVLQAEAINNDTNNIKWAEKEVLHYRSALINGIQEMKKLWWISTNLLISLQNKLEPSKSWIRKLPGTVIANSKDILYTPPVWEEIIVWLLSNLEKWIHDFDDWIDPLIKVGVIHYQFESIHPFYDGNGRTGRLLMILYLILTQKLDYPILFISEYINKNRSEYYQLLNRTGKNSDYTDFILFILDAIISQSQITQQKIINIRNLISENEKKIKELWIVDYHHINNLIFSNAFMSVNNLWIYMWVSRQTAAWYVNKLLLANIIKEIKIWRNKLIYNQDFINQLV